MLQKKSEFFFTSLLISRILKCLVKSNSKSFYKKMSTFCLFYLFFEFFLGEGGGHQKNILVYLLFFIWYMIPNIVLYWMILVKVSKSLKKTQRVPVESNKSPNKQKDLACFVTRSKLSTSGCDRRGGIFHPQQDCVPRNLVCSVVFSTVATDCLKLELDISETWF